MQHMTAVILGQECVLETVAHFVRHDLVAETGCNDGEADTCVAVAYSEDTEIIASYPDKLCKLL